MFFQPTCYVRTKVDINAGVFNAAIDAAGQAELVM